MEKELVQSILKTLVYFDIVDYPLTSGELYSYVWRPPHTVSYEDFVIQLDRMVEQTIIETHLGYYCLPGRKEIVEKRRERLVPTELLLKKAQLGIRLIRFIPFLKAVFICNSIASETATEKSDIDFFIITTSRRAWLVRFFSNLILYFTGIRRHGTKIAERICLSFYIDEDHLNIGNQRIADDDIHFIYWLKQMLPLYDPDNFYEKFKEANAWTNSFLPYFDKAENFFNPLPTTRFIPNISRIKKQYFKKLLEAMMRGKLGDWKEGIVKKIQQFKMKKAKSINPNSETRGVIIDDGVIKLHEEDSRKWYRDTWIEKTKKLDLQ